MATFGRTKIFTTYKEITDDNILSVLTTAYPIHLVNVAQINYLYNYYRGNQPILTREKKIRPEHNAKIVQNYAYEIANFIAGYLLAKPIQYVALSKDLDVNQLATFNGYVVATFKESQDMTLAKDRAICGTGYRIALPKDENQPFDNYRLDPRNTFVVYSSGIEGKALLGVVVLLEKDQNGNDNIILQAYSDKKLYIINQTTQMIREIQTHSMGQVPIIEYPLNDERIGSFEVVESIIDAINLISSDQVNAITQFVQALMVFKNIEISKEMLESLKDMGAINITDNGEVEADIKYITQELNQNQVQTLKNDMVQTMYKIVGMPQQNSGGGGDNGVAVIYKDGWTEVEAKMRPNELAFKESERKYLELVLSFTKTMTRGKVNIQANQIEIKFTRSNYENIAQKVDAFAKLMAYAPEGTRIAPILAYQVVGLFNDPEQACLISEEYSNDNQS